jgi:hypothetical protein
VIIRTITFDFLFFTFFWEMLKKERNKEACAGESFSNPSFPMLCVPVYTGHQFLSTNLKYRIFDSRGKNRLSISKKKRVSGTKEK